MKTVYKSKLLRLVLTLTALVMLLTCLTTGAMAETATQWITNAGHESLVNVISNTEFELIGTKSLPTELFSYDPANTNVSTDISTTDISFSVSIEPGTEEHGDFYGIFVLRISDPSVGIWGPANSGVSLQFNKGQVILRRWSRGVIDTEHVQTLPLDILDGEAHEVNIKVEEYTVTATVDGESVSVEYAFIPSAGGYQFMAYNGKVKISGFEDGTAYEAPPATEPPTTPQNPTTPPATNPLPSTPTATDPVQTDPAATDPTSGSTDGEADNSLYIIIAVVAVVVCAGIGLGYYFLVVKKKK